MADPGISPIYQGTTPVPYQYHLVAKLAVNGRAPSRSGDVLVWYRTAPPRSTARPIAEHRIATTAKLAATSSSPRPVTHHHQDTAERLHRGTGVVPIATAAKLAAMSSSPRPVTYHHHVDATERLRTAPPIATATKLATAGYWCVPNCATTLDCTADRHHGQAHGHA
jgi:hypothetical protein